MTTFACSVADSAVEYAARAMTEPTTGASPDGAPALLTPEALAATETPATSSPAGAAPPTPIATVSPSEVPARVARARAAQSAWANRRVAERVKALLAVKDRLLDRAEAIARAVNLETGKLEVEALLAEIIPSADVVDYWTESIEEMLDVAEVELDKSRYPGKSGSIYRDPCGVIALITPWNYPVALPLRTLVPALLAGNAVVWKPSEVSPRAAQLVFELFDGLVPNDVLMLTQGAGDVGAALASADVDRVVFVGRAATGRHVAHACAERLSPCTLEVGGKDAAIVLADANLDRAANGIVWGALTNAGQSFASIERVYVESAVAKRFVEKVVAEVKALRPGTDIGPLATEAQHATARAHIADAKADGARVLVEGDAAGLLLLPSVVEVDDDDSVLMRDETFGPVIPIAIVADAEEAIRRANASRFDLTASLWTTSYRRGAEMAHRLRAGVVTINNHGFAGALPMAPWSGHGAVDGLTRPRFVLTDRSRAKRELWWYPYSPVLRAIALSMTVLKSRSAGIFRKIGALFRLLTSLPRRF
jgi:acyl-CoA reductase-like NAD-dependent aldehyde dehydrogenase